MNTNFEELKTWFDITQRSILDRAFEILNVSTNEWTFSPQMRSTPLHDKENQLGKSKSTRPVLCLGKMYELPEANASWKE